MPGGDPAAERVNDAVQSHVPGGAAGFIDKNTVCKEKGGLSWNTQAVRASRRP